MIVLPVETMLILSPILYVDVNLVSVPVTTVPFSGIDINPGAETLPLIEKISILYDPALAGAAVIALLIPESPQKKSLV